MTPCIPSNLWLIVRRGGIALAVLATGMIGGCAPRGAPEAKVFRHPPLPARIAFTDGKHTWKLEAAKLGLNPAQRQLDLVKAAKALHTLAGMSNTPGKDARISFTREGMVVTRSEVSRATDVSKSLKRLVAYTVAAYPPAQIELSVTKKPPKFSTADLLKIKGPIASFVTSFNPGVWGRTRNVRLVTERLNGALVPAGGVFSFNDHVGPRLVKYGFQIAHIFVKGKMVEDVGGGTCQVSSTLYNAVLLGGLGIVERYNHSLTVPYVRPGRDATVYFGSRDFKFKNTTEAPIYIRASASGGRMAVTLLGAHRPKMDIQVVSWSRRRGDRVYGGASRLFKQGDKVVRREFLSSDVYKPL